MYPLEETHTYRWVGETLESIFDGGSRITGFAPIMTGKLLVGS